MSELPSRDSLIDCLVDVHDLGPIAGAYVCRDLGRRAVDTTHAQGRHSDVQQCTTCRQEFIDSLDMTLLIDELQDLKAEYFNNAPCCQVDRTEALFGDAKRLLAAALGEETT